MDQDTAERFAAFKIRTMEEVVGANLTRYREREGISQAELGRRIGQGAGREWSRQAVSLAESGKRAYGVTDLVTICHGTKLTMADLLTIHDDVDLVDLGGETPIPAIALMGDMQLSQFTREVVQEHFMNGYYRAVVDMQGHVEKVRTNTERWFDKHKADSEAKKGGEL
jgi:transcriptional regulator with XRE-family HTH domain